MLPALSGRRYSSSPEGGPHLGSWEVGERYARNLINDLNRWTVGWIDWNLLLDETGGPNHVGNFCSAPIMADRASGTLLHQSSYWVLGHFARFLQPGGQRVLCASSQTSVEATAAQKPDASTAIVATIVPASVAPVDRTGFAAGHRGSLDTGDPPGQGQQRG